MVKDEASALVAGPGCSQAGARVRCPKGTVTSLRIDSADLADVISTPKGLDAQVAAGAGDDQVTTNNGADALSGGSGADRLDGGPGPDVYDGGPNRDLVDYSARRAGQPITVDLDGVADDGGALDAGPGGRDNLLPSIENVTGGGGGDSITGGAGANVLIGGLGADRLHGLAGGDTIRANGDGFNDTITCGPASDRVYADAGDSFPSSGPDACEAVG